MTKSKLREAWEHVKDGGGAGRDGVTPEIFASQLDIAIRQMNRRLRANNYSFMPYTELLKSKGAGKLPRVISVPAVGDRIALRAMATFLRTVHKNQISTRLPQDLVAELIRELSSQRWDYFLKLDIQQFYPSISHDFLRAALSRTISDERIVATFIAAVETPTVPRGSSKPTHKESKGVPQGLPISNGLAELTLEHLDRYLRDEKHFFALRFVDDIIVLTHKDDAAEVARTIRSLAAFADLKVHDESSGKGKSARGPLSDGFDFLGYVFEWPRVTVRAGSVAKLESRLARSFTAYKYAIRRDPDSESWVNICKLRLQWHLDLTITGFTLDQRRIGWLAYFSQIRNHSLLHKLDSLVASRALRFGVSDVKFKSFVRTYRIVSSRRTDPSGYVPNFDDYSEDEMRYALGTIFNVSGVTALPSDEVKARFYRRIRKLSRELEADIPSYR
jgi:RNA-directed DNA polymerase